MKLIKYDYEVKLGTQCPKCLKQTVQCVCHEPKHELYMAEEEVSGSWYVRSKTKDNHYLMTDLKVVRYTYGCYNDSWSTEVEANQARTKYLEDQMNETLKSVD